MVSKENNDGNRTDYVGEKAAKIKIRIATGFYIISSKAILLIL